MIHRGFRRLFQNPFRQDRSSTSIREELDFHLDEKTRELLRAGWSEADDPKEAERQFGDREGWTRATETESRRRERSQIRGRHWDAWRDDVHAAVRQVVRQPFAALTAVVVLGTGIGFAMPIVTIVDQVLLRPAPFPDPDRLVWLVGAQREGGVAGGSLPASGGEYLEWATQQRTFESLAATQWTNVSLGTEQPQRVRALRVEPQFFDVLRIQPAVGRPITAALGSTAREVVLSDAVWHSRFGGDPEVVGSTETIDNATYEVVGVMPPDFRHYGLYGTDVTPALLLSDPFVGWGGDPNIHTPAGRLQVVARIASGATLELATEDMRRVAIGLVEKHPAIYRDLWGGMEIRVLPYLDSVRAPVRSGLLLILATAFLLLVVVAGNASGVFLATIADRQRELTVRSALGANRIRLVRQVMTETGLLILIAGGLGALMAHSILPFTKSVIPGVVPRLEDTHFDARAAGVLILVVFALWLFSALLPAIRGTRVHLAAALGNGGSRSSRRLGSRWLLATQLVVTTALISSAGVLVENQRRVLDADHGFDSDRLAVLRVFAPAERYASRLGDVALAGDLDAQGPEWRIGEAFESFVDQVLTELRAMPGVEAATFSNTPPLWGSAMWSTRLVGAEPGVGFIQKWVAPDFKRTLGLEVARGRWIQVTDVHGSPPVVVVNRTFVDQLLPGDVDPVGHPVRFWQGQMEVGATIVGVIENIAQDPIGESRPVLYQPLRQRSPIWPDTQAGAARRASFIVRTSGPPEEQLAAMREALWRVDPSIPVESLTTLDDKMGELNAQQRFFLLLMAGFSVMTLLLAAAGTGALFARKVHQRTREIGIRRALGSTGAGASLRILSDAGRLALVAGIIGLLASFGIDRLLESAVVGFSSDPIGVRLVMTGAIVLVAIGAAALPARRTGRVDPIDALRAE